MTPREELLARQAAARARPPRGDAPPHEDDVAAALRAVFYRAAMVRFRRRLAARLAPLRRR